MAYNLSDAVSDDTFMDVASDEITRSIASDEITEITEHLYVSGYEPAIDEEELTRNNIKIVIVCIFIYFKKIHYNFFAYISDQYSFSFRAKLT